MVRVKSKRTGERKLSRSKVSKTKSPTKTVEEYLASIPESARDMFGKLRAAIKSAVPRDAAEIVSYQILAFKKDRVLVWFAAFSGHCSLFPTAEIVAMFQDELESYPTSKGTIQFPADRRLPIALIKRMVIARVQKVRS